MAGCPSCRLILVVAAVIAVVVVGMPDYDEETAKRNMLFAGVTYCYENTKHNISDWSSMDPACVSKVPDFQITKTFYNKTDDGFGLVGLSHDSQIIVAAFKGTDETHLVDWIVDLTNVYAFPDNCSFGSMADHTHKGFCREYHALKNGGIYDAVIAHTRNYPTYKVVVTGHSLGAALAMLLALDLMITDSIPVSLYTYGQPRTVASGYAMHMYSMLDSMPTAEMYRVTHYKDVVPHIPYCKTNSSDLCVQDDLHGYHSGYQIHYNEDFTQLTHCKAADGADCNETFDFSIDDHLYYFGVRVSQVCCPPSRDDVMTKTSKLDDQLMHRLTPSTARQTDETALMP